MCACLFADKVGSSRILGFPPNESDRQSAPFSSPLSPGLPRELRSGDSLRPRSFSHNEEHTDGIEMVMG